MAEPKSIGEKEVCRRFPAGADGPGWWPHQWGGGRYRAGPGRCRWYGWLRGRANKGGGHVWGVKNAAVQIKADDGDAGNLDITSLILNIDGPGVEVE